MNLPLEKKKLIVILAIFLFVLAPILGTFFMYTTVFNETNIQTTNSSAAGIIDAYHYPFSLTKGQKIVFEFSVSSTNVSATFLILEKAEYATRYAVNATTNTLTGSVFLSTAPSYSATPSAIFTGGATTITSTPTLTYAYIEFMGSGTAGSSNIWSVPGNYEVVVYGTNAGITSTVVYFDLKVTVEGMGEIGSMICNIIGWILLIAVCILFFIEKRGDNA